VFDGGSSRTLLKGAGLLSVAVAGGAVALLGAWLFGGFGEGTTTVREMLAEAPTPPPASVAATDGMTIGQIYERDAPGVVQITAKIYTQARDPIFGTPYGFATEEKALGSGFVLSKEGYILTSYHVVHGASEIHVSFSNNDSLNARIVGSDPTTDVAVLKVSAKSRAFKPLQLGNSDSVRIGDSVVALGNPFGYTRTVTAGIVSALQRRIQSPNSQTIDHIIQTDAAINPGNSGGPLIDTRGQVVGVNAAISAGNTGEAGSVGIGFAVPINTVKTVAEQLISTGKATHPYIGLTVQAITPDVASLFALPVNRGLIVQNVYARSPAAKAGVKGGSASVVISGESYVVGGDVITSVDGVPVGSETRFRDLIAAKKPGEQVTLEIYRGKRSFSLDVPIGRLPATNPPSLG
jgi:S1-C subfamily serine protease